MTTLITLNFFCPSKKRDPTDSFGEENEEPSLGKGTSVSVLADNIEHACTVQCVNALYCTKSSDMMILSILLITDLRLHSTSENFKLQTKF